MTGRDELSKLLQQPQLLPVRLTVAHEPHLQPYASDDLQRAPNGAVDPGRLVAKGAATDACQVDDVRSLSMRIDGGRPQGRFVGGFEHKSGEDLPLAPRDARVGHGKRRTEDLRHEEAWRDATGDFHGPVQPHAKSATKRILFGDAHRLNRPRD